MIKLGESGLGKTTFMNTLFNTPLTEKRNPENIQDLKTISIQHSTYGIE